MSDPLFLIWSFWHKAWWRPDGMGYTTVKAKAGRYTYEQAMEMSLDHASSDRGPSGDALIKETR